MVRFLALTSPLRPVVIAVIASMYVMNVTRLWGRTPGVAVEGGWPSTARAPLYNLRRSQASGDKLIVDPQVAYRLY